MVNDLGYRHPLAAVFLGWSFIVDLCINGDMVRDTIRQRAAQRDEEKIDNEVGWKCGMDNMMKWYVFLLTVVDLTIFTM